MAISELNLKYAELNELYLDPRNPRLGREATSRELTQDKILRIMRAWDLEELASSFLENGFWLQEALIVVQEKLSNKNRLVVVEGNRRLGAIRLLDEAYKGEAVSRGWADLIEGRDRPDALFHRIPYLLADARSDIDEYLGFRHVTGIKEWNPAEKAEYIARLIDARQWTYDQVRRKIGSKASTVRQNYIAYHLLRTMESNGAINIERVEDRFGVLYRSLNSPGVRDFLGINIQAPPQEAQKPVPQERGDELADMARWMFGDDEHEPIISDSRQIDKFGTVLDNKKAVAYLRRTHDPDLDQAYRIAGGEKDEIIEILERMADRVESLLKRAYQYADSGTLHDAAARLERAAAALRGSLHPEPEPIDS